MDCDGEYVNKFIEYVNNFIHNIRPNDPLPVQAPSYHISETEVDGQIIDIVFHYLNHRECPPYVRNYVARKVWCTLRHPELGLPEYQDVSSSNFLINKKNYKGMINAFDPMKLIQDVATLANGVLMEFRTTLSRSQVESLPRYLPVSHYAIKNTRRKMEDRHIIIQDLNTLYDLNSHFPHSYYAVFDGHGGVDAAAYTAAQLHQYLVLNPLYDFDPATALMQAFSCIDANFIKKSDEQITERGSVSIHFVYYPYKAIFGYDPQWYRYSEGLAKRLLYNQ